jgi:hypothetical protein
MNGSKRELRRATVVRTLRAPAGLILLSSLLLAAGCASIMHGTSEQIGISSSPTGAQVTVDGVEHGVTPMVADLKRKDTHIVRVSMAGYEPFEMALTRHVSGWVWGNLVFGGIPGLAIDAITGGLYKLSPDQVSAQLQKSQVQSAEGGDVLLLTVVMHPTPGMVRIGALMREGGR